MDAFEAILLAKIIELKARRDKARAYELNSNMFIEANLCQASLDALEKELEHVVKSSIRI
jgi:hypothetical protein